MDVLEFSDVNEVLGFDKTGEQFEMVGNVRFFWAESEVLFFV